MKRVNVHHPELSPEEREARIKNIKKAAKRYYQEIMKGRNK